MGKDLLKDLLEEETLWRGTPCEGRDRSVFVSDKQREKACILIGAGDFSQTAVDIRDGDLCIAVDGGYVYCNRYGITPDLLVGDFDSIDEAAAESMERIRKEEPERLVRLNPVKDDTDMMVALQMGLKKGYRLFYLYGALGGRIEHSLANIQCLSYLKSRGADACLVDGKVQMTVICDESIRLEADREGFFSLFSLSERAQGVTIRGMKYLLDRATVTDSYPVGISNEFIGREAEITVEKGKLLLILSPFE